MSPRLIPSADLIRRTIEAEVAYTFARLRVLERIPGNPIGVAYRHIDDGLIAMMARNLPSPSFNRVAGLRPGHERHIEPLTSWYRDGGARGSFEIVPGNYDPALGRELARCGYFQSGFHASLFGEPNGDAPEQTGVVVRPVSDEAGMELYLDAYVAGWGIPAQDQAQFKSNVRPWLQQPGWRLFAAFLGDHPAGAATLYLHDKIGYCADAATDPAFRRRGVQTTLLRHRIRAAAAAGVDFVCSGAEFLSASHRNMERVGMRILFVRSLWTAL
jgi:ribosomal protein S18 acetylase RimI-like enzyme